VFCPRLRLNSQCARSNARRALATTGTKYLGHADVGRKFAPSAARSNKRDIDKSLFVRADSRVRDRKPMALRPLCFGYAASSSSPASPLSSPPAANAGSAAFVRESQGIDAKLFQEAVRNGTVRPRTVDLESAAVDQRQAGAELKLVALGMAAEVIMVVENEDARVSATCAIEVRG
jgi:hypothetical protein